MCRFAEPSSGMWLLKALTERKADVHETVKLMRRYQFADQAELDVFEEVLSGLDYDSYRYAAHALRKGQLRPQSGIQ